MDGITIGVVAKQAKVNIDTLRYYERRGILPRPLRTAANYRLYTEDAVRRVRFIKRAQELGFTLSEIKELLALRAAPRGRCAAVRGRAELKMRDIEAKIASLNAMRSALATLVRQCRGRATATECPILESLGKRREAENN